MFLKFVALLLMLIGDYVFKTNAYREINVNGVDTVLAMEGEPQVVVNCNNDIPMAYCGFLHPNGTRFSFSGMQLNDGRCSVTLATATKLDSGVWKCYIGKKTMGAEIVTNINVRVADRLAAVSPTVRAVHGTEVTLLCTTTRTMTPLSYCRFEPPSGKGFSINANVTSQDPIWKRYFYPQNKSLDRGDCAVTIGKVKLEDFGNWTCGAGLEDDGKEYTDVIILESEGMVKISATATVGIIFSVILIIIVITAAAYMYWKKRNAQNHQQDTHEVAQYDISPEEPHGGNIPLVVVESPSEPSASSTQLSSQ